MTLRHIDRGACADVRQSSPACRGGGPSEAEGEGGWRGSVSAGYPGANPSPWRGEGQGWGWGRGRSARRRRATGRVSADPCRRHPHPRPFPPPGGRGKPVDLMAASVPEGPGPSADTALRAAAPRRRGRGPCWRADLTRPAKARHEIEGAILYAFPVALA
jgi:hypothetical protein